MIIRFPISLVLVSYCLAGFHAEGSPIIYGQPISVDYSGSASRGVTVNQTAIILAMQQDFISLGPDLNPLFDVSFGGNQLTITALENFNVYQNGFLAFNWIFQLEPTSGLSFTSANLVSSSLFSIPPFGFPVNPPSVLMQHPNQFQLAVSLRMDPLVKPR
jgi:hypothetical protein